MLVQSDTNIFLQLHKKNNYIHVTAKVGRQSPQKKTMKNQINTLLPTNINISPMDNPNKKKTLKNEIITSKRSRVPSRERSTITYSRLPGVEKRVFITGGVEKA